MNERDNTATASLLRCLFFHAAIVLAAVSADGFEVNVADNYGYDPQDSADFIQAAIDSGASRVIIPNTGQDWVISHVIHLRSNQEVFFEDGVVVAAKPGAFTDLNEVMFRAAAIENTSMIGYGATIRMNKAEYTVGQGRHTMQLRGVENVTVKGLTFADSGGDGIYIHGTNVPPSRNVLIEDTVFENHRRQGISVLSAVDLTIRNVVLRNTNGTAPSAGIDFEPDTPGDQLTRILLDGVRIEGNNGNGVLVYLRNLNETTAPISIDIRNVDITDTGHHGVSIAGSGDGKLAGHLNISNTSINGTGGAGIFVYDRAAEDFTVDFQNITIADTHRGYPGDYDGYLINNPAPMVYYIRDGYPYSAVESNTVGGIGFSNVVVHDIANRTFLSLENHGDTPTPTALQQTTGTIIVRNPYGLVDPDINTDISATWLHTPFFRHGFETEEGFTGGSILRQKAWYRPGHFDGGEFDIVISDDTAQAGPAVLRLVTAEGVGIENDTRVARAIGPDATSQPFIVAADMAIGSIPDELAIGGLYVTDDDNAFTGAIFGFRKQNGQLYLTYRDGETFIQLDATQDIESHTFYRFLATIDSNEQTYTLRITDFAGELLAEISGAHFRGDVSDLRYITFNMFGATTGDTIYLDNLYVAPIPEPATAAVVLLFAAVATTRRHPHALYSH